jgi:predicted lipoprotein with Yx(FWY)xxD motif
LVALGAFAAACGGSGSSGSDASSAASSAGQAPAAKGSTSAVTVTEHSGDMGNFLTDSAGRTLYLFASDTSSKSTCSGACASQWPPLTTKSTAAAGSGVTGSKLTTISRDGGTKQVSYNGHPLYYFAGDSSAGQTNGEGINNFGASWYIVSPAGSQILKGAAPAASSSSGSGSTGSGAGGGWS